MAIVSPWLERVWLPISRRGQSTTIEVMCRNNAKYMAANGNDAELVIDRADNASRSLHGFALRNLRGGSTSAGSRHIGSELLKFLRT